MFTCIGTKQFEVKETNGKLFYYSKLAGRWLPVKKSKVIFESDLDKADQKYEAQTMDVEEGTAQ